MKLNNRLGYDFKEKILQDQYGFLKAVEKVDNIIEAEEMNFKGNKLPFSMQPLLISSDECNYFKEITELISNSLEKLLEAYINDDNIKRFFSYYNQFEKLITLPPGYKKRIRISRFDTIWYGGNDFKILEPNTCCPGGVVVLGKLKERYLKVPYIEKSLEQHITKPFLCDSPAGFISELLEAYKEMGGQKEKPTIAFANYNGNYSYELSHMKKYTISMGFNAVICDLTDLKLQGENLYYNNLPIDIIYNKVDQLELGKEDMQDVLTAIENGYVCSVNSYASMFIGESKMTLALLTDREFQEKYLTNEEIQAINKHVPWTRKLANCTSTYKDININLIDFTLKNKDKLVLKIDNETRGNNVFIGNQTSQEEWISLINKNQNENWVVQEYYSVPEICVPVAINNSVEFVNKKFGIDMFMFGGKFAGVVSRISDNQVINVGQGGFEQPVIEVTEVKEGVLV